MAYFLLLFGVVSNHIGQSQDQEWYKELQNLNHKLGSLVLIVSSLWWWNVGAV